MTMSQHRPFRQATFRAASALCAALLLPACALAQDVIRHRIPGSDFPIARAVEVPAGKTMVHLSGAGPVWLDRSLPATSPAAYGNTRAQTVSTLKAIEATLTDLKLGMGDVVRMQVFLVGDPALNGEMDFAGFMAGYREFFGTAAQPNLPVRSTMKVAGLANTGWLVEIEVSAVRP
jgi:enamine deaminase RidA (YjgF/YER057c/UK114 family)